MSGGPAIIELFGMPGAGKSTISDALLHDRHLTRFDLARLWRSEPMLKKLCYAARAISDTRLLWSATRYALVMPLTNWDSLRRLGRAILMKVWLKSQKRELLLDQAMMQHLVSIHFSARDFAPKSNYLLPLLRSLYRGLDAQLIFLELDAPQTAQRLLARSYGRSCLDGLPEDELSDLLERSALLPSLIADAAVDIGLKVLKIDASRSPDAIVKTIRSTISSTQKE